MHDYVRKSDFLTIMYQTVAGSKANERPDWVWHVLASYFIFPAQKDKRNASPLSHTVIMHLSKDLNGLQDF